MLNIKNLIARRNYCVTGTASDGGEVKLFLLNYTEWERRTEWDDILARSPILRVIQIQHWRAQ